MPLVRHFRIRRIAGSGRHQIIIAAVMDGEAHAPASGDIRDGLRARRIREAFDVGEVPGAARVRLALGRPIGGNDRGMIEPYIGPGRLAATVRTR